MTGVVSSAGLVGQRWVRFDAVDASPYDLARYWAERVVWPVHPRSRDEALHELAVMSRLGAWLYGWQPILIHLAVLAGADAVEVAAACGTGIGSVESRWRDWVEGQRRLEESTHGKLSGPSRVDVARVAEVLVDRLAGGSSCLAEGETRRNWCAACAEDRTEDCSLYGPEAEQ